MKHLILILALIAFVTGGYASNVFAAEPDVSCVDCLDHEDGNIDDQCQDCECHHSHVIGLSFSGVSSHLLFSDTTLLEPIDHLASNALPSLYRPPIA
ncbi:MAG: hypothetical protein R3D88_08990 [Alphaproteobacteria bacterium]